MKYENPIIRGFNPDPSICRVGDDFYLLTSTFEFFPGVPIYHSKNLVNWELIGYCLNDEKHNPLKGCRASGGIYAPTLRYHNGLFYMITTNTTGGGNFIVTTDNLLGEWSEPKWIKHQGIDPDLFWDDDGKCYYTGTGGSGPDDYGIYTCEINPDTGEILSDVTFLTGGDGGVYVEGPHLYKINGMYYLMLAEGGTEYGHHETIFRAPSVKGPWESCPHNPILSHRDTMFTPFKCTGHADLVEDQNGNWWMVSLGIRPLTINDRGVLLHNLGRETFLSPVVWENGWPVVGKNGNHQLVSDAPLPGPAPEPICRDIYEDFGSDQWNPHLMYIRNPYLQQYKLDAANSKLVMYGGDKDLSCPDDSPTFVGLRQVEFDMRASTKLSARFAAENQRAGITAYYNDSYHYEMYLTQKNGDYYVCLNRRIHDLEAVTACHKVDYQDGIEFKIESDSSYYRFYYKTKGTEYTLLGQGITAGLCTEGTHTMTFTGTLFGLFAVGAVAEFDYFNAEVLKAK